MKGILITIVLLAHLPAPGQVPLEFVLHDINERIRQGSCVVTHSPLDIGSIHDVFDQNAGTLARSANVNPLVITLSFAFPVRFSSSAVIHAGGEGWWSLEAADNEEDLSQQTGTYVSLLSMTEAVDDILATASFEWVSRKIIRLTVMRTTGDDYVHLREWQLPDATGIADIVEICHRPSSIWLKPNTSADIFLIGKDLAGAFYPITQDDIWNLNPFSLCTLNVAAQHRVITAGSDTGEALLSSSWNGLTAFSDVHVVDTFTPSIAAQRKVQVALVIIDPPIAAEGGLRFHQRFGWDDPQELTQDLRDSLNAASEGAIEYEVRQVHDANSLYASFQGTFISFDSIYRLFLEPGWTTFHQLEQIGGAIQFDYNALLNDYNLCSLSNTGDIDEVWVYSMPFTGMYESRLTGTGAFWYNAPPLSGNECIGHLPVMGFNYERGVAEAMHSFGHRVESAMVQVFGRWDYNANPKNDWEKFSSFDLVTPGAAHCGNIHFPPNATSDYDYSHQTVVSTLEQNWATYPFLFDYVTMTDCMAWDCSHLGFMSWWFRHLPHFTCKNKEGMLNNWWPYIVDFNEGRQLEKTTADCGCVYVETVSANEPHVNDPSAPIFVSPNPFTDQIFIQSEALARVHVTLHNIQGSLIGHFDLDLPGSILLPNMAPGVYVLRSQNEDHHLSIRLVKW